jgi:hypothetical protein
MDATILNNDFFLKHPRGFASHLYTHATTSPRLKSDIGGEEKGCHSQEIASFYKYIDEYIDGDEDCTQALHLASLLLG